MKCRVPFQMVVLESAPEKALEATVDKWLEWDLGETRQEVTREKKVLWLPLIGSLPDFGTTTIMAILLRSSHYK